MANGSRPVTQTTRGRTVTVVENIASEIDLITLYKTRLSKFDKHMSKTIDQTRYMKQLCEPSRRGDTKSRVAHHHVPRL